MNFSAAFGGPFKPLLHLLVLNSDTPLCLKFNLIKTELMFRVHHFKSNLIVFCEKCCRGHDDAKLLKISPPKPGFA